MFDIAKFRVLPSSSLSRTSNKYHNICFSASSVIQVWSITLHFIHHPWDNWLTKRRFLWIFITPGNTSIANQNVANIALLSSAEDSFVLLPLLKIAQENPINVSSAINTMPGLQRTIWLDIRKTNIERWRLFVWFGLNVAFNLFQSYCDGVWMWQGAQCSLLECCLTEISRPRHFDMIFHPVTL